MPYESIPLTQEIDRDIDKLDTRIVEVASTPNPELFRTLTTRRERLSRLEAYFAPEKEMIVGRLAGIERITVKDLVSSNTLIVTAPEATWAGLVERGGALDLECIRIHRNESITGKTLGK